MNNLADDKIIFNRDGFSSKENVKDNFEEIQNLRNKIKISLMTCEKVLDDFSNLVFIEKTLYNCDKECFNKFSKLYQEHNNDEFFYFADMKKEFFKCTSKCEDVYRRVIDHQIKGAEISYFTYQKHLNKCKEINRNEPDKLLNCYNHKVEKIIRRFGSYYFNQRINLANRLNKE